MTFLLLSVFSRRVRQDNVSMERIVGLGACDCTAFVNASTFLDNHCPAVECGASIRGNAVSDFRHLDSRGKVQPVDRDCDCSLAFPRTHDVASSLDGHGRGSCSKNTLRPRASSGPISPGTVTLLVRFADPALPVPHARIHQEASSHRCIEHGGANRSSLRDITRHLSTHKGLRRNVRSLLTRLSLPPHPVSGRPHNAWERVRRQRTRSSVRTPWHCSMAQGILPHALRQ